MILDRRLERSAEVQLFLLRRRALIYLRILKGSVFLGNGFLCCDNQLTQRVVIKVNVE